MIMVSPYVFKNEDLEGHLAAWRARRHRVIAVLFDEATFPPRDFPADSPQNPVTNECARRLASLGAETYIVRSGANLEMVFRRTGA